MPTGYEHWGEEASRVSSEENDFASPYADMSDDEIKEAVYASADDFLDGRDD